MTEISLHLLDLLENSARAGARNVRVVLEEDPERAEMVLRVEDDGSGMTAGEVERALDPFYTTVPGKKVGLGLALLRSTAEAAGGTVSIRSAPGEGTVVSATFKTDSLDRPPLGDVPGTLEAFLACHPEVVLVITWKSGSGEAYSATWPGASAAEGNYLFGLSRFREQVDRAMRQAGFERDKGGFVIEVEARS